MIIGGGMAFTFKKTLENMKIGNSLFDEDGAKIVEEIMKEAKAKNVEVLLPVDFICGDRFAADAKTQVCDEKTGVPEGWMGLDVGPKTVELARAVSRNCCVASTEHTIHLSLDVDIIAYQLMWCTWNQLDQEHLWEVLIVCLACFR